MSNLTFASISGNEEKILILFAFGTLWSLSHDVARSWDPVAENVNNSWRIGSVSSRGSSRSATEVSAMAHSLKKA